ncbi:MAG: hypothetical protein M2R45_05133 [Verrucomicrobia subdivision 3 bacterium]|nr:hypothetical protein [Limisphaerales bacterium]MCS1417195.1 hypothetical protein [Limisphaerales bacterium]
MELANDEHMWFTMCASDQMAKFELNTKELLVCSSAEAPAKRGSYPHTLRINPKDPEGLIWYTDTGRNSRFSIHSKALAVKECPCCAPINQWPPAKANPAALRLAASITRRLMERFGNRNSMAIGLVASIRRPKNGWSTICRMLKIKSLTL